MFMETNCNRQVNILLGCTGSVAACRVPEIVRQLKLQLSANVRVVPTENALFFLSSDDFIKDEFAKCGAEVFLDSDEWKWRGFGDPILHIELKKWADILLIAPLDANTLAKISIGLADNLLTCIARAWEIGHKPVLFALAMNSSMILHPLTTEQVSKLKTWQFIEIPPVEKMLACGDIGPGGIADTESIVTAVRKALSLKK